MINVNSLLERKSKEKRISNLSSNLIESPESFSYSINKKEMEKILENYILNDTNKNNKKISTSAKKINVFQHRTINEDYFNTNKKQIIGNSRIYNKRLKSINSCPLLVFNHITKTEEKPWKNIKLNNYNPNQNIDFNLIGYRNKKCVYNIKKIFHPNKSIYSSKGTTTFNNSKSQEFLLDKRIKIIKKPRTSYFNLRKRNKKNEKDIYDIENNYHYKKMFDRKLPLNDLRYYKPMLFEEIKSGKSKTQYFPPHGEERVFTNKKIKATIENNRKKYRSKINSEEKNNKKNNNSKSNNEDNIYEICEFNGNFTKIMTKLPKKGLINQNENKNEDFHQIIKHPLLLESFGYKYLRNLNRDYKVYNNPLDDKDLIYKIHNLIINPNSNKYRNGKLLYNSARFFKNKSIYTIPKDYKILSEKGYIRLRKQKINALKKYVKENVQHINEIKEKYNLLIEKKKNIIKEDKEE